MASYNKITMVGNLTADPELRNTSSGVSVADLRLAVNTKRKNAEDEVCYVNVTVWDKSAEACAKYLHKGSPVLVDGRLKLDQWEKDGQRHSRHSIVASVVQFLGGKSDGGAVGELPEQHEGPAPGGGGVDELGEMPF